MRRPEPSGEGWLWLLALVSQLLPLAALGLGVIGAIDLYHGNPRGPLLLVLAGTLLAADIAIDLWLGHPSRWPSAEPDLNRRGAQLIGRTVVVAEAIVDGRGKVRVGDTLWLAEGPDAPEGAQMRVSGVKGTALIVEVAQRA